MRDGAASRDGELGLRPGPGQLALYALLVGCGLVIHYSVLLLSTASVFWLTSAQGIESSYFTLMEFSRLPRQAFTGLATQTLFVWLLPVVMVTNVPASLLVQGFDLTLSAWLFGSALVWFAAAVFVFNRGLRRYTSASS